LTLLVAFVACGAAAQTLTGTISGRVTDEQGGVLPGVTVTLTGKTGSQTQPTDSKGEFRFLGLAPGMYSIKAELQGFRPKEQQGIEISVAKTAVVNLAMAVGGLSETVDVVANAVTIDTSSSATDTNMSQDLLFSMPLTHNNPAVNILQYTPGYTDGSVFGSADSAGNALMLDGVDTRDPEGGTAWTFYNYDLIDEIQVGGLGQQAEYGGFTGAVVNTITKSGGNRFSHLSEYRWTDDSSPFFSNNADPSVTALNPLLGTPVRTTDMKDYTVQLGGPLKKDKIFFFGSVQRYKIEEYLPPTRTEVSPRFNMKVTFQPTSSDNIVTSIQYDQYNQTGRVGMVPAYAITSHSQTIDQDSPEAIYNAQYRKVFSSSTFLEAKFTGWWGYYDLNPVSQDPTHIDALTGAYSGGAGYVAQYDRTRNQLNVALSKYAQAAGSHNFKFGVEIEYSTIRDRYTYSGTNHVYYTDYAGQPLYAYGYSYDLQGKNKRESYFAQDQWKMGSRLTANIGLRADHITGSDSRTGTQLYDTTSFGPRLGAAFDITGKGTSVLRGYYGQLYDGAVYASWKSAATGVGDFTTYAVGSNWSTLTPIDVISGVSKYTMGSNIKQPKVDEVSFAWEQQFMKSFKFTATGIYRDWHNFINSVLPGAEWTTESTSLPAWTGSGASPVPASSLTYYSWANPEIGQHFVIQNVDTVTYMVDGHPVTTTAYRKYKGAMFVLERAMKNRWQAQFSWVISKTTGTVNNGETDGISSGEFQTPNTILLYQDGPTNYDRRHMVRVFAGYQIPKVEVMVSGYYQYHSGEPYAVYYRVPSSLTNWNTGIYVNIDNRDQQLSNAYSQLDLRLEKVFSYRIHRFGVYADISNLFNQNTVLTNNGRYPSTSLSDNLGNTFNVNTGGPLSTMAGRQIILGARWSF
jgi:hypothetical protein